MRYNGAIRTSLQVPNRKGVSGKDEIVTMVQADINSERKLIISRSICASKVGWHARLQITASSYILKSQDDIFSSDGLSRATVSQISAEELSWTRITGQFQPAH